MENVCGYVGRIRFRNNDNGYTVFTLDMDNGKKEMTCVGRFSYIEEGMNIRISGEEILHPTYGRQVDVRSYEVVPDTGVEAIKRYLSSGAVKGVGQALAKRITDRFADKTFDVIENEPERLAEIKGISERMAREIAVEYAKKRDMRDCMIFLSGLGISETDSIRIYNRYKDETYNIIKKNPYELADDIDGIGFKKADEIAMKSGFLEDSDFRIKSAVIYQLKTESERGSTCLPRSAVFEKIRSELGVTAESPDQEDSVISDLMIERKIVVKNILGTEMVFLAGLYYREMSAARKLFDISSSPVKKISSVAEKLDEIGRESGIVLEGLQREAVTGAAENGLLVITGGPGTGKTTAINAAIKLFDRARMNVVLAAPTGRAAKRMTQATGHEASTIHRLLEANGDPQAAGSIRFDRNEENPVEADVIIIDEMSMVDTYLFHALLAAVADGTRLILIGDRDQLPSVGPGNVLNDIIESGCFKVITLNRIFRQHGKSDIVLNAHMINEGKHITLDNRSDDFFFAGIRDEQKAFAYMTKLLKKSIPEYLHTDLSEIVVLTPTKKGNMGAKSLNRVFQEALNPQSPLKAEHEYRDTIFREGDKVMQIKNNYQLTWQIRGRDGFFVRSGEGIFNGETGIIRKINERFSLLEVEFDDGKRASYGFEELDQLELAYAITVHKSQGSEYGAVILALMHVPDALATRNILYTAVTRARSCVCIVGFRDEVFKMIDNNTRDDRFSGLKFQIREMFEKL